jgi:hypothetical protein
MSYRITRGIVLGNESVDVDPALPDLMRIGADDDNAGTFERKPQHVHDVAAMC